MNRWTTLILVLAALVGLAGDAFACPTCSSSISQQGGIDFASGYFWGILFLLTAPFLVFGLAVGYLAHLTRHQERLTDA